MIKCKFGFTCEDLVVSELKVCRPKDQSMAADERKNENYTALTFQCPVVSFAPPGLTLNKIGNIVARSRNRFCSGITTMHSSCVVELHVTVDYTKMLSVAQR